MTSELSNIRILPPEAFLDDDFGREDLLRLNGKNGRWTAGQDKAEVASGTRAVAVVDEMLKGFVRFDDAVPQSRLAPLWPAPDLRALRQACGDLDQGLWDRDPKGQPIDPWKAARKLPVILFVNCEKLIFATNSGGGVRAVSALNRAVQMRRQDPAHADALPIVSLEVESYDHKDKQKGTIFNPLFDIVGWATHSAVKEAMHSGNFAGLLPAPSKRRDEDAEQPAAPRRSSQMKEATAVPWDDDRSADAARERLAQAKRGRGG